MSDKNNKTLKPGWRRVKFGDVVRLSKARSQDPLADGIERYVGLEHLEPGDLRIRSWGSVADGVTFTSVFQPGQVLFGKRRAYQRKVAVADFSGVCSGDIYVLETKDAQVLLPDLLPFICQTDAFFDHAVGTSAGSLSPRTNWTSLADFEFVLPSIAEQRRISLLLLKLEEVANSHHQLAEVAELATTSLVIDQLHVKRLDPYRGFLHGIPRGCALTKGEDIFIPQSGNGEPDNFERDGDCIFLKVSDFNLNDEINIATGEAKYSSKKYPSLKIFGPGTVVFPKRGASIFLNKVGILRTRAALDPNLMALTLHNPEQISPEFLYWLIKAIGLHRMADVTSVPQLNHKHLSPMRFALPDAAMRIDIVDRLASIRGAWKAAEQRRLDILKFKAQIVEKEIG